MKASNPFGIQGHIEDWSNIHIVQIALRRWKIHCFYYTKWITQYVTFWSFTLYKRKKSVIICFPNDYIDVITAKLLCVLSDENDFINFFPILRKWHIENVINKVIKMSFNSLILFFEIKTAHYHHRTDFIRLTRTILKKLQIKNCLYT